MNDTSGTINAYNNVKDLNGSFKACRVHFLVIHAATQCIQYDIIDPFINMCTVLICICLGISLNNKVVQDY